MRQGARLGGVIRVLAGVLLALGMAGPAPVLADGPEVAMAPGQAGRLMLTLGKSEFVDFEAPFATVVVGNPAIADAVVMSPQRFYLLGQSIGTTNVQVLDADGAVLAIYDLVVGADVEELDRALASALPNAAITVHSVNGRIRLSGSVEDDLAMDRALEIAANFTSDPVINTLVVRDPKQVFLKVQIIEAVRTVGQELGLDISTVNLSVDGVVTQNYSPLDQVASVTSAFTLDANLRALVANGLARYLAAPTLSALSGETASFLAGGETPIPISTQDSSSIEFKEFGVRLNFTPQVMDGGLINLNLEAEVSQIDLANSYTEGDNRVPGFSTRRAQTTVELRTGESFVIAGLLQSAEIRGSSQYPWLGNVPILGPLFRTGTLNDSETELLIIVTPSLTRPLPANVPIATPLDGMEATEGADLFIDGQLERRQFGLAEVLAGEGVNGPYGPILEFGGEGALQGGN